MKKWEYTWIVENYDLTRNNSFNKTIDWYDSDEKKTKTSSITERQVILDMLGEEGWELVGIKTNISSSYSDFHARVIPYTSNATYFFKRELEDK